MAKSLHDAYNINSEWYISTTVKNVSIQRTLISKERHSAVTPEQLSKQWNIGLAQPKQTP
jgi:hypothetical protein